MWPVGIPALVALFFYRPRPLLILIGVLALVHVWPLFKNEDAEEGRRYRDVPLVRATWLWLAHLALAGLLALMAFELHQPLP